MQWTMVEKMSENADQIIIAGDDDQAFNSPVDRRKRPEIRGFI